jgi:adenosylmethionine-8-amino-7-oxononanoate aminotransferase
MPDSKDLLQRDLKHVWHPCSHQKDLEHYPPLIVNDAEGSFLYTDRGPVIDAISSWWCKALGHRFAPVTQAIQQQLLHFEQIIGADTTYPQWVDLAEELAQITQLQHAFFASDGSSAVEIALKLALQAQQLRGSPLRNQFIALKNGYHGETMATLSVSDLGKYKQAFSAFRLDCHFLQAVPYVSGLHDPQWSNFDDWPRVEKELQTLKDKTCALIFEPIVQGAGGMRCYSADFLQRLARWAKENGIYLIADEIMTGFGRTGTWLACEHANIKPDLICLSKGLSSGTLPISCVMVDDPIYQLFYHDALEGKSFLHSHTYSGNPLAVSAALATIRAMRDMDIMAQVKTLSECMQYHFSALANSTQKISNIRCIGGMIAGDLETNDSPRLGHQLHQAALQRGALLRPLDHSLYWLPPLNTTEQTIETLAAITRKSIEAIYL